MSSPTSSDRLVSGGIFPSSRMGDVLPTCTLASVCFACLLSLCYQWQGLRKRNGSESSRTMFLSDRQTEIVDMAKSNGRIFVEELASHFQVTPQTIRKDLNDICDAQILTRSAWRRGLSERYRERQYEARRQIASGREAGDRRCSLPTSFPTTLRCSSTSERPPRLSARR
jgi:hypothetical protein